MCGRYVVKSPVTKTNKLVKSAIQVEDTENYNAHPYQKLPVIKKYKKKFDAIYPKLSKKYNLAFIPFLLEGVALNPSLNQQDGIHPNKEGTIKVSETIKKSIINILN